MRQVDSWVITPTSQSYQYDAISIAGGRLMSFSAGEAYARVPLKEVLEFDPEVILSCGRTRSEKPRKRCPGCISQDPPCWWVAEELKDKNGWKETSAAKQDRIYALPCELLCRPGPRVVDGMESIFRLFYLQT
jgi:iron complex transport system substrate-binding protein